MSPSSRPARARPPRLQILLVGVGGQGVLTTARVLGAAAHAAGHGVVVGQLHGMSQRGGSVECSVILGDAESSFLLGPADVVVAFEPLELQRARSRLGPDTKVLVSLDGIAPFELTSAGREYPDVEDVLGAVAPFAGELVRVSGGELAALCGEQRTLNLVMLGALAGLGVLPFDARQLWQAAETELSPRFRDANRRAFELGLERVETWRRGDG